jgi:hypothetical protein
VKAPISNNKFRSRTILSFFLSFFFFFLVLLSYKNGICILTSCDSRDESVLLKSLHFISVLLRLQGVSLGRRLSNPALPLIRVS